MNRVELVGRVTKDIELRTTPNGKYTTTFVVAAPRRNKDDGADFITCVAWGKTAELLSQYVHKGHRLGICGRIQTRNYESNGRTMYVTEVVVDEMEFLESKQASQPQYNASPEPQKQSQSNAPAQDDNFSDYGITDDDLPF